MFSAALRPVLLVLALGASVDCAAAQKLHCPEGYTKLDRCVNPELAATARKQSIMRTQSRLSQTALPVLPNADPAFRDPTLTQFLRREISVTHP